MLAEILVPAGRTVPAGSAVCEFRTAGAGPRRGMNGAPWPRGIGEAQFQRHPLKARTPGQQRAHGRQRYPKARCRQREPERSRRRRARSWEGGYSGRVRRRPRPRSLRPIRATPLARRMAATEGIDLGGLQGPAPEGTVTREDVEQALRGTGLETGARSMQTWRARLRKRLLPAPLPASRSSRTLAPSHHRRPHEPGPRLHRAATSR